MDNKNVMSKRITLKGITWDHSRGFVPVTATAQRFSELNPDVDIVWQKRSLQEFADFSIEQLAEKFDLLVIDHPWAGFAARTQSILPLDKYLPASYLDDQQKNSVGKSYESYTYDDHQWALPIDAATPVASSRPDLLAKLELNIPQTYEDLLQLAGMGWVAFSLIPIDTLMSFYMFCSSLGEDPCLQEEKFISDEIGVQALQLFRELAVKVDPVCYTYNPIKVYEAMTTGDKIAFCPFAYGYSNYSRKGYARKALNFHDMVMLNGKGRLRSTLGGTGLAVSSQSKHIKEAVEYAAYTASPACQRTLYFDTGGQPGHLSAWQDDYLNDQTKNYFWCTLPALQRAFLRPRYHGHMYFQDHAGKPVRDYLMNGGSERKVLSKLNDLYLKSRKIV